MTLPGLLSKHWMVVLGIGLLAIALVARHDVPPDVNPLVVWAYS